VISREIVIIVLMKDAAAALLTGGGVVLGNRNVSERQRPIGLDSPPSSFTWPCLTVTPLNAEVALPWM
jgi:hypothetical protein